MKKYLWYEKSKVYSVLKNGKWVSEEIDSPPILLNNRKIIKQVRYPIKAQEMGISGEVLISVVIDKYGKMSNVKVKKGVHDLLDSEALRVTLNEKHNWFPAKKAGRNVTVEHIIPYDFALE